MIVLNIYVYKESYIKYENMASYINRHVECNITNVTLPSKFKNDNIYKMLPESLDEMYAYMKHYNINDVTGFYVQFNK